MELKLSDSRIDYEALERQYDLYIPGLLEQDEGGPIKVTLHYAGPENKAFARKQRNAFFKYRAQVQRNQKRAMEITREAAREVLPGVIVTRCDNVPTKSGGFASLTELEDLQDFCQQLPHSAFDEIVNEASMLDSFLEDGAGRPSGEDVKDAADDLGKS